METHNPWLAIWTRPKATIQKIVAEGANRSLLWLSWAYGFCSLMNLFQSMALGSAVHWMPILLLGLVVAPLYGYLSFCVWSFFVLITGKLFKGAGRFKEIRAAYAWSCVPIILNIPIWFLLLYLFREQIFVSSPQVVEFSGAKAFVLFVALIAKVVLAIWSLVIFLNGLVQVQGYSMIRAIFNSIVAAIALGILFFVLWTLFLYSLGGTKVTACLCITSI